MEKACWFKDWFNSSYYHLLYNKRDVNEANFFITNLCNHLKINPNSKIWDLACGKGRHSIALSKKGFNVIGTDLSENSIQEAINQKEANVEFYVHDMRKLFRTNYFDCVVNLFTSIGYFENYSDNFSVFKSVYASLKPNGIFVVDFLNAEKVKQTLKPIYIEQRNEITFQISKQIINNVIHKKINFEHQNKSYFFEETVTLLQKTDFENFASSCGFKLENVFGDYALNNFDKEKSDRLILIFKK
jgi:cyclopropane fatty-acyl-phospholipid synthase-like methyltransferase